MKFWTKASINYKNKNVCQVFKEWVRNSLSFCYVQINTKRVYYIFKLLFTFFKEPSQRVLGFRISAYLVVPVFA